jgi:hypothetical protein
VASVAVVGVAAVTGSAFAVEGWVNGLGQGAVQGAVWTYPNQPPGTPNFLVENTVPQLTMGPNLPGANPLTRINFQTSTNWATQVDIRAAMGDTADWHSMLPHTTPTSIDATGSIDVITSEPFGGNARLFTVTWSASDPGVAMHIGWFENGNEIFETPVMIGPFQRVDTFLIEGNGPISLVQMHISAAARSIVPSPGTLLVVAAGGLLAARRRR